MAKIKARATGATLAKTKNGDPQIAVAFELDDGRNMTWFGYFTEKTKERTVKSLRYCGWTCDDIDVLTGLGSEEVELVVEAEEYGGVTRDKIQWVNRIGGGLEVQNPMADGEASAFAKSLKGFILSQNKKTPSAKKNSAPKREPGDDAEEALDF